MKKQLLVALLLTYVSANHVYDMTQEEYDAFQQNPKVLVEFVKNKKNDDLLADDNDKETILKENIATEQKLLQKEKVKVIVKKENKDITKPHNRKLTQKEAIELLKKKLLAQQL